jgi:glucoamylase
MKSKTLITLLSQLSLLLSVAAVAQTAQRIAPGAPGERPHWTNGNKQGVGTSNTLRSKVWFSLGNGALNEVYYPTIDKANTRSLEMIVTDGLTFAELESRDTDHKVEIPYADALVFRQVNTSKSNRYKITKTYITDPAHDTVMVNVTLTPLRSERLRIYVLYDPAINNSGLHDTGYSAGGALVAADGGIATALISSAGFVRASNGYLGTSDGWKDLKEDFKLDNSYARAVDGNVVQVAELSAAAAAKGLTIALGFAAEGETAIAEARASLDKGFNQTLDEYRRGWSDYLATLKTVDQKYRDQFQMSAMVLKAHEDKTYRGAGVASLTVPWGDDADASEPNVGGYHLVWSRDLYQVATAFYAMGDKESADRALNYLFTVQQRSDGSYPQNSWLDGRPFWQSLQLDEVAYPMILAYQLGRTDPQTYEKHIKISANFLVKHGPATPQERWEEEAGYSPSTIAAQIAGLVCAAEIAQQNNDETSRELWLKTADEWARKIESWTVADNGPHGGRYFIRLSQEGKPNSGAKLELNNGSGAFDEREIVDAGFLELVRLGIRSADDPLIRRSIEVVDRVIKVETPRGPAWYRYNHDGYGEKADGHGYDGTGIGRLWILLAGERGEYEVAAGREGRSYLDLMQRMANEGRMLAEQVWDRAASPSPHLRFGEGTGSATPLAWTNAQFIRLAIAVEEGKLPETPAPVTARYQRRPVK